MFGKKFFGTVALSGATVSLVGSVFAEGNAEKPYRTVAEFTCKDGNIDYDAFYNDKGSYFWVNNKNGSWSLKDLSKFFHLDKAETGKLLNMIICQDRYLYLGEPDSGQISVIRFLRSDKVWEVWVVKSLDKLHNYSAFIDKECFEKMLKTHLNAVEFLNSLEFSNYSVPSIPNEPVVSSARYSPKTKKKTWTYRMYY